MATTEERPKLNEDGGDGDFMNSRRLYHGAAPYVMGKKVFDFGCGYGHGAYFLHPWTMGITAFDLYPEVAGKAQELFGSETLNYTSDLASVKGPFDIVVSVEAIEHLEKPPLAEKLEWFASIAPSVYATTPNGNVFHYRPERPEDRFGYHIWHYNEYELIELFRRYYSFVDVHGVLRDPNADQGKGRWMGYAVFATNLMSTPEKFMTDYRQRQKR